MSKKTFVILLLILFAATVILLSASGKKSKNKKIDYTKLQYTNINITEIENKRYEEKINNSKISGLISNLCMIQDAENIDGYINYCIFYAQTMDYNAEENIRYTDWTYYINLDYMNSLLNKIFGISINNNTSYKIEKEELIIPDEYVEFVTDSTDYLFDSLAYNSQYDVYKVNLIIGNEEKNYGNVEIIYKENGLEYTILNYKEASNE